MTLPGSGNHASIEDAVNYMTGAYLEGDVLAVVIAVQRKDCVQTFTAAPGIDEYGYAILMGLAGIAQRDIEARAMRDDDDL